MKRERLLEILSAHDKKITEEYTDSDLVEYVSCLKQVHSERVDDRRWWDIWEAVYEVVPGTYVRHTYAVSTGDSTPKELGYEGNGLADIAEVTQEVISTYKYTVVKD